MIFGKPFGTKVFSTTRFTDRRVWTDVCVVDCKKNPWVNIEARESTKEECVKCQ